MLSFAEYGFDDRFSQERPINYEEYVGKWGVFWDKRFNGFTEFVDSDSNGINLDLSRKNK